MFKKQEDKCIYPTVLDSAEPFKLKQTSHQSDASGDQQNSGNGQTRTDVLT